MRERLDRLIDELDAQRGARRAEADGTETRGPASEREAFFTRHPFDAFWSELQRHDARMAAITATVEAREEQAGASRGGLWAALFAPFRGRVFATLAAACTLVLAVGLGLWLTPEPTLDGSGSAVRFKGGDGPTTSALDGVEEPVGVRFFVRRDGEVVPGVPEGVYREGDQLRFTYWSGDNDYLMVLSVEDSGSVSVYYPDDASGREGDESIQIARGRNVPLEGSIVLNDYVGHERFFALFSPVPISVDHVKNRAAGAVAELRREGRDVRSLARLPVEVPQASFWIRKR